MRKVFTCIILILNFSAFAHNGKVGYAQPQNIVIDGKISDWKEIYETITIGDNPADFCGELKLAYDYKNQYLFIGFEIQDNDFSIQDVLEIYINAGHLKRAPSNFMLKFQDDNFTFFKHNKGKDFIHQHIIENNITYKINRKGKSKFFELSIHLPDFIVPNKTIGFDLLYVDVDKNEDTAYHNWGKGYYGFLKEYNSGQLGDIILLETSDLKELTGAVKWKDKMFQEAINEIKIESVDNPDLWIITKVDSLGNYTAKLPIGKYKISSAYKLTNPWASWGENNQFRIDDSKNIVVDLNKIAIAKLLELEMYGEPKFLIPLQGILTEKEKFNGGQFDAFVKAYMMYYNIPGASIALIKDGKIIYHNVYGVKSFLSQEEVDERNVFQAASVTKPAFAFIANRLIDRGELELDKPLCEYLEFANLKHDERYKKMTTRHVLSHQSGLPNWAWGGPLGWKNNQKTDLLFTPGEGYGYSGEAFQYLGRVVEKITGKGLNTLLQEELIQPLGIPELYFFGNDKLEMVNGHVQNYPTYYDMVDYVGVAHSLLTEANSFAHFVRALINKKGLSDKQYKAMFNTEVLTGSVGADELPYWNQGLGLGFFTQDTQLGKAVMHGGSNGDFQSEFVLFPELKSGFVMFTNSNTGHKLGQALGRYLFYGRN